MLVNKRLPTSFGADTQALICLCFVLASDVFLSVMAAIYAQAISTTTLLCHSEERSDEESLMEMAYCPPNNKILRSLWSLRMT